MVAPDLYDEASVAYAARKELGPEYERAVLESFVASATEAIDQRVDTRLAQQGAGRAPQKERGQQGQQPDNSHVAVPVFSLLFGVGGSIWLTAGAGGTDADSVFAMWLGIVLVNLVFTRSTRKAR
ncbi:hypothetical protein [Streptomyces sp. SBT349]|uniref:hypothetical protein n=1 Tax=Streptomyces sp. SBT349 TaxID=1580539 RepID=UPI00066C1F5C|nr:hypothetical protein [Streptomyces sp. SBT349]